VKRQGHLQDALDHTDQAELYGAFSILAGEVTAEEHDRRRAEFEADPAVLTPDYGLNLQQYKEELQGNESAAEKIADVHAEVTEQFADCDGPRLGAIRSIIFNAKHRMPRIYKRHPVQPFIEAHERSKQLDFDMALSKHGKCGNKRVIEATRRLPQDYLAELLKPS
jgi:hypothetical protein